MIRYLSLFSGIGAFEKALDNLGIPYELLAYCEVDKPAFSGIPTGNDAILCLIHIFRRFSARIGEECHGKRFFHVRNRFL